MQNKRLLKRVLLPLGFSFLLAATSALRGDTLVLRDGRSFEGTYFGGNDRAIRFQVNGAIRYYSLADVENIQFGPALQSPQFIQFQNARLQIDRPRDWGAYPNGDSVTFAPPNSRGGSARRDLAYGAVVNVFQPRSRFETRGDQWQGPGFERRGSLERSMNELIDQLHASNAGMREMSAPENISVDGARALSVRFTNDSPIGGRETDWLVAAQARDGLIYFLFTAPEREFSSYEKLVFQNMLRSVHFAR